jgi:hypothetical protein
MREQMAVRRLRARKAPELWLRAPLGLGLALLVG